MGAEGQEVSMDESVTVRLENYEADALASRAQEHGRSIEEEASEIVREHLRKTANREYLLEWSRRIRAMTPKDVPQTDSLALLREDRDR
jgi:plasmid stability protein